MRTFSQLIGTTDPSSPVSYPSSFTTLSNNNSAANVALAGELVSNQYRYLIQKYFDNEKSYATKTIGAMALTLTATPAVGDTSATLSVAWPFQNCHQLVTFPGTVQRDVTFVQNSTTISWQGGLTGTNFTTTAAIPAGATSATLATAWPNPTQTSTTTFSDGTTKSITYTLNSTSITWAGGLSEAVLASVNTIVASTTINTIGVQFYPIPAGISKIKNSTITVGQLVYTPSPVQSIQEWTYLNALPYTSDIPNQFYIYNNQVGFWPIPSSTGNIITFNYKARVADLSFADYSTGTLSGITAGSNAITGSSTSWNTTGTYPLNTDLSYFNLFLKISPPKGEGIWYKIKMFTSDTALLLTNPIQNAPSSTAASYTIGQIPELEEDFHDMPVLGALMVYYSTVVSDPGKYKQFKDMYDTRLSLLADYGGTKTISVDLGSQIVQSNPNLYIYSNGQ